jgi:hypothetical protein
MNLRKVITRRIRRQADGVDVQGDINAVVAANVNEPGSSTAVSSSQRIVQRSGRAAVSKDERHPREADEREGDRTD